MADDFSIRIKTILDASKTDLDRQIDELSKKLKGIDLGIDKEQMSILGQFVQSFDKIKDSVKDSTKVIKEEVNEIKKLDGSVEKVTKQFLHNGEIIEKTKVTIKEQKEEIDKSTQSAGKLLDEWDKIGNKIKEVSRSNGQGEFTGGTDTYQDNFTQQQIKYNKDLEVTSEKVTENILQEQKAVDKLKASLSDMSRVGLLSADELSKFGAAINDKDFEKANELYTQLINKQKELLRVQSLGENKGSIDGSVFSLSDDKRTQALTDYIRELYKAKGASDDLEKTQIGLTRTFDSAGNEIYKYNVAIKDGSGVAKTYAGNIDKLSKSLYENSQKTRDASNRSLSLAEQFKIAASRVPIWLGATTLYFGTLHTLESIVDTIVTVDTKMTELKRVMDSSTNFNQFLQDSISLSTELSRSLSDVLDISNEFARQGYTSSETLDLTRVAGMLQNISDLTPEESLDALIAGMKNYNIQADQSITIADKLNEVDNNYSVSTQQLATSMFKAASTAKAYGVTLDELIGQTTAVSETTRESGEVVGNFLKTLYSQLMTTSKSRNALDAIGISVKNTNGEMKSATQVLTELHDKWSSLSQEQQQSTALSIAGERQISRFYALMQNYGDSISAANTALNSQNSAVRENAKYQDSLQARITRLQTAWQQLALEMGNAVINDSLINVVQSLTKLAGIATVVVDKVGVLPIVFGTLSTSVILLSARLRGLATSIIFAESAEVGFTVATEALTAAFRALVSATVIGAVFVAVGFAIEKLIGHYGKLREEQEKQKQQTTDMLNSYKANKDSISQLADEYEKMSSAVSAGELAKNDKDYLDVQTKLGNVLPTTIDYIDQTGQAHLKSSDAIKKEIDSLNQLSKLDSRKFVEGFSDKLDKLNNKIRETSSSIKKNNFEVTGNPSTFNMGAGTNPIEFKKTPLTTQDKMDDVIKEQEYQAQLNDRVNLFKQLSSEYQTFLGVQNDLTQADKTYIDTLIENNKAQLATKDGQKKVESQVKVLIGAYGELRKAFGSGVDFSHIFEGMSADKIAMISELVKGYKSGGETVQQFTKILEQNGFTTDQVIQITNALTDAKKGNVKATDDQAQAQDTLNKILDGSLSAEDALAQSLLGYTKDQIDSNSTLIEVYAGLSKAKNLDASQSALLAQVYDELKSRFPDLVKGHDVSINALYGEANAQDVLYQAVVASANGQLDAEHQKTLGMALELQNQKKIVEQQIKLYQAGLDAYVASEMAQNDGRLAMNGAMMANYRRIQSMQAQVDSVIVPKIQKAAISLGKALNISPTFKTPDWNFDTKTGGSGSKSSKPKSSSTADTTKVDQYQTDKYTQSMNALNLKLKEYQNILDGLDKTSKSYRDELSKINGVLEDEKKLTQGQVDSLTKQDSALQRQLNSMGKFNKLSSQNKQKYNDIAKQIDDNKSKIIDYKGTLDDLTKSINNNNDAIKQSIFDQESANYTKEIDGFADKINQLGSALDKVNEKQNLYQYSESSNVADQMNIYTQQQKALIDQSNYYSKIISQLEEEKEKYKDNLDLVKQINDQIGQYQQSLSSVNDQIVSTGQQMLDLTVGAINDYYQNQIDAEQKKLDLLNQQIDAQDKLNQLQELDNQIAQTMSDKRFEYIDANGNSILTYDKSKVTDLQKQRSDLKKQIDDDNLKQSYENEITNLQNEQIKEVNVIKQHWMDMVDALQNGTLNYTDLMSGKNGFYTTALDDLTTFTGGVSDQVDQLKALFQQMLDLKSQVGTSTSFGETANNGLGLNPGDQVSQASGQANEAKLQTDPTYVQSEKQRTQDVITKRKDAGLDTIRQENYLKYLDKFHEGGVVSSSPNRLTDIANRILNTKLNPNEQIIKVLKGELLSPTANIAQNLIPNLRMITNFVRPQVVAPAAPVEHHYFIDTVNVKANNASEFVKGLAYQVKQR